MAGPDEEGGEENGTGSRNSLNITRNMEVNGNRSVGDSYMYMYPILVCIYLHCIINVHVYGISFVVCLHVYMYTSL